MTMQNFIVCMLDAHYKYSNSESFEIRLINYVFSAIFAVELSINMFANWLNAFVSNGWNWLDVFVVAVRLRAAEYPGLDGVADASRSRRLALWARAPAEQDDVGNHGVAG